MFALPLLMPGVQPAADRKRIPLIPSGLNILNDVTVVMFDDSFITSGDPDPDPIIRGINSSYLILGNQDLSEGVGIYIFVKASLMDS